MFMPDKIELVPLKTIIPYARNARLHSEEQVKQIAASIREFGWMIPVLIEDDNTIIAGHGRCLAAELLGIEHVPCIRANHLTKAQKKAYRLVDNKLALNSTWDTETLKLEIAELSEMEYDTEILTFDEFVIHDEDENAEQAVKDNAPRPASHDDTDTEVVSPEPDNQRKEGAKELSEGDFSEFDCKCPRCGFEFDQDE